MPRAESLDLLNSLVEKLGPIGQVSAGAPLKSADWNALVDAVRSLGRLVASRESTTDEFLDERYATRTHEHPNQVALSWLDPPTGALIERSIDGAVEQQAALKSARDEIARLRAGLDALGKQFDDLRAKFDGLTDSDSARGREVTRVAMRVESLRDVEGRVSTLGDRIGTISDGVKAALEFRKELVDANGRPIDVKSFAQRIADLEGMRDNLKTASGDIVHIREIESALARLEENSVDRGAVDEVVIGRLSDPNVLRQSGMAEAAGKYAADSLGPRFDAVDRNASKLEGDIGSVREAVAAHDGRIAGQDRRLITAESQLGTLSALPARVDEHQSRINDMDSRVQANQAVLAEVPLLRSDLDAVRKLTDDIAPARESVSKLTDRVKSVEDEASSVPGLVAGMADATRRVGLVENELPALRLGSSLASAHDQRIGQIDLRVSANESELDNLSSLRTDVSGIAAWQTKTSPQIDDLVGRTSVLDGYGSRIAAVEQLSASNRQSLGDLRTWQTSASTSLGTLERAGTATTTRLNEIAAGVERVTQTAGQLRTALDGVTTRLAVVERRK